MNYFTQFDGNGNVLALVRSDGLTATVYEYGPFGELLRNDNFDSAINDNTFRFSTKFLDLETGLVNYGNRYYSPSLGRFINRDPIGEAGGLNLYGFCGNDGIDNFDVMGNSWLSKLVHNVGSVFTSIGHDLHHWETWSQHHSLGASAIVSAVMLIDPIIGGVLDIGADEARLHDTWHFAQQNPQVAAAVAAIATWYIGGWGAAAVGIEAQGATAAANVMIAGASAGFAGGFVGARASGADLSTSFRCGYQGAAFAAATAYVGAEVFHAYPSTDFSFQDAYSRLITSEERAGYDRLAHRYFGISGWRLDAYMEGISFVGYALLGDAYHDKEKTNGGKDWYSYVGGFGDRQTGVLFKWTGDGSFDAHYVAEFAFDVNDILLNLQGLPDAGGLIAMAGGEMFSAFKGGHSLGAARWNTLASFGLVQGGVAMAMPVGVSAVGGVTVAAGTGDPVTGYGYLDLIFNPSAILLHTPGPFGHNQKYYDNGLGFSR